MLVCFNISESEWWKWGWESDLPTTNFIAALGLLHEAAKCSLQKNSEKDGKELGNSRSGSECKQTSAINDLLGEGHHFQWV